jgi:cytochrome b subunit of formate dehydrogenase
LLAGTFFFLNASLGYSITSFGVAGIFLAITLIRPDFLLPLNRLWMIFGLMLGTVISPMVLGFIFYGLFTPIALFMRLIGRDELNLRYKNHRTYWKTKIPGQISDNSFKNQF